MNFRNYYLYRMMTMHLTNEKFTGADNKESLYDLFLPENWNNKLIIFIHGYMGYKDWGCWNLVQDYFTANNFGFLKYNESHNGGTIRNPIDFDDPDAFSKNTFSKELTDLNRIIQVAREKCGEDVRIFLIGHSRGGAIALLQSKRTDICAIASWAAIASFETRFPTDVELQQWKKEGIRYHFNTRTGQSLPVLYDLYLDFQENKEHLDIAAHCRESIVPTIVIHGEQDTTVDISEGKQIAQWLNTDLQAIEETGHTFGAAQPWEQAELPEAMKEVCGITLKFFETREL